MFNRPLWFGLFVFFATAHSFAQQSEPLDGRDGRNLALDQFRPKSMLKVKRSEIHGARYPAVDVHSHFAFRLRGSAEQLDEYVQVMDRQNIAVSVSLDAKLGSTLEEHQKYLWTKYRDRFVIFVHVDWMGSGDVDDPASWDCNTPGFANRVAQQLIAAREQGASGLKVFKRFGLDYRNADGSLIRIDDPRWDPIWKTCGEQGFPILIHTADPAAFFLPIDETNERWEELHRHPDWSFPADRYPAREELLVARNRVIGRHPKTNFIAAHLANNPEDLATVSKWLEQYPNLYVEIASRIGELGRQPYTAKRFLEEYSDRVMLGTDGPFPEQRLVQYWRFLQTMDEYFPYSEKEFPPQGFWNIYGLGLSNQALEKILFENAERLIPGVRERRRKYVPLAKP